MKFLQGWSLTVVAATAVVLIALAVLWRDGLTTDALRLIIRITARTSLVLFSMAFTAASLVRWRSNVWTRWQMKNRRYLGVAFAASHLVHAGAIIGFAVLDPELFDRQTTLLGLVGGLAGYGVLIAMTATSFDGAAAWLGARAWKRLHTVGSYYLWFIFGFTFLPRTAVDTSYWLPVGVVLAAMVIRISDEIARHYRLRA